MNAGRWTRGLVSAALLAAAPLITGATSPGSTWQGRVLSEQNRERGALGLDPMRWNVDLAVDAQQWADHLARSGRFEHAPERPVPQGENLWAGTKGWYSPEAMVDGWLAEKRNFKPGIFPANSRTGRMEDVGHYTQIVWRASGPAGGARPRSTTEDLLVCRYSEAGNWVGERPF